MFIEAYKKAFSILTKKPFRLWGLSLLVGVIEIFATLWTFPFLSIVGEAFIMVVSVGMAKVYLDALDGKEVNSDQLFAGLKRFWQILGGVAWKALWIFIWAAIGVAGGYVVIAIFAAIGASFMLLGETAVAIISGIGVFLGSLVMIAGVVFAVIKSYSYAFVEYILITDETVSPTEALRRSVKETKGKVGQMFLADLLVSVAFSVVMGVLGGLAMIPYVGFIFGIVAVAAYVLYLLVIGIFRGLYMAAFYKMPAVPEKPKQAPQQPYDPYQGQQYGQYQAPQQPYQAPQQPYQAPQQPYQAPQQPYQAAPQQPYQATQQPYQAPQQPYQEAPQQPYQAPQQPYQEPQQAYQPPQAPQMQDPNIPQQ